jgi:hypothetical protein
MAKSTTVSASVRRPKVKRLGVHAKSKQSSSKTSKNYVKPYISQGK